MRKGNSEGADNLTGHMQYMSNTWQNPLFIISEDTNDKKHRLGQVLTKAKLIILQHDSTLNPAHMNISDTLTLLGRRSVSPTLKP